MGAAIGFVGADGKGRTVSTNDPLPVEVVSGSPGSPGGGGAVTVADGADVAQGATTQAAAPAAGTGNYTLLQAAKRGLLNWADLLGRIPALVSGRVPVEAIAVATDANGNGTREYNLAAATRTSVGATSSAAVAIGTLGSSRELMMVASTRCFVRFGNSGVAAAAAADADVLPVPADAMFHLRVPAGVTHFRVIRDSVDGFLRTIPVA